MPPDFVFLLPPAGIFAIVFATVGLVALLLHLFFNLARVQKRVPPLANLSMAVVTVAGALFGLSITFLANSVWNTEDRARETVNAEARSIRVMEVYLDATREPPHADLYNLLAAYGQGVADEWGGMYGHGPGGAAERALRSLYTTVVKGFGDSQEDRVLQQHLLSALDLLSTARQQRLSMAQDIVSLPQWLLVLGLGLVLLVMMAVTHAQFRVARRVALATITVAMSIMLFVIVQHDRPFIGHASLTPEPILRAAGVL